VEPVSAFDFTALTTTRMSLAFHGQSQNVAEVLEAGATEAELTETIHVAAALRAGAAITHGTHLLEP